MRYCLAILISLGLGSVCAQDEQAIGYEYLNELRNRAGMIPLSRNENLESAAENHSQYLTGNSTDFLRYSGHFESPGDPFFTGNQVSDRTSAAGYFSTIVSENVSNGQPDTTASIDDLMVAIYHRFGFLSFNIDEVGLGFVKDSAIDYSSYTYNMGNAGLNSLCMGSSFNGTGAFFQGICAQDSSFRISSLDKNEAEDQIKGQNPYFVTWPPQGDTDVPPAFYEESPDPLPDFSVSGNPVSLQFNPLVYSDVTVTSFRLFEDFSNLEIGNTRLLNRDTDPNMKFTGLEYALFPLDRLDWNTVYRVEVHYTSNLDSGSLIWKFATRSPGAPLYKYSGDSETVEIPANAAGDFVFYIPPSDLYPTIGGIGYSFSAGMSVDVDYIDNNTLSISMVGSIGQQANFSITGRSFSLRIGEESELPEVPEIDLSQEDDEVDGEDEGEEKPVASFDETTGTLSIPLLIVDDAEHHGITLKLIDEGALTFAVDTVAAPNGAATGAATFTSSTLELYIPTVLALGTHYSIKMKLIDAAQLVLQITAAEELAM